MIKKLYSLVKFVFFPFIFILSKILPKYEHTWIYHTGDGENFSDNSKYLYLYCNENKNNRNIWICTDKGLKKQLENNGYECYMKGSLYGRYYLIRASVVLRTHGPIAPAYTSGATHVQLSHGNYLKKMGYDESNQSKIRRAVGEFIFGKNLYYVVTSRGAPKKIAKSAFGIPDSNLIVAGLPRNDILTNNITGAQISINQFDLQNVIDKSANKTSIFWTPTWRNAYGKTNGQPFSAQDLELTELDAVLEANNSHLFVSPHPYSKFDVKSEDYENISIISTGGDIYPFLRYCDVLITDYSGIFYDFLLLDRPIIFFAPDLKKYNNTRGLYFEYRRHVPGPVAEDPETLRCIIHKTLNNSIDYSAARDSVRHEFYSDKSQTGSELVYSEVRNLIKG